MSAWDWNYAVLRTRWPAIAAILEPIKLDDCAALMDTPSQALVYRNLQITSAFDPMDEAKRQAEGLDREVECVYCYGIGLGYLPAVLAARHKEVCVVILNATVAKAAMVSAEQKWLSAPHVGLSMAADVPILYIPYASVPMEARMADQQGYAMRDRLFAHLNQRCIETFHFGVNIPRDQGHVNENKKHTDVDQHVVKIFGSAAGSHIVLVGGGPTVAGELDWLRQVKTDGALVVAASTALRFLLDSGVTPDYCVNIDTLPEQIKHLDGVSDETTAQISLVYHPTVNPEFVSRWKGKRFYYGNSADLYTSGTVMHTAADLAVKLGAKRITMLGCDFCYPEMQSHVPGVFDAKDLKMRPTLLETIDGNGNRAYTDFNLAQYHRHMEDYIAQAGKGVQWFKRGRLGVTVRGAAWE